MPQAIPVVAAWIVAAGAAVGVTVTAAVATFAATVIVTTAYTLALGKIMQALAPRPPQARGINWQANYSGTMEPRRTVYGEVRAGGMHVIPGISTGDKGKFLHFALAMAGHECDSLGDVWFDEIQIASANIGAVTGTDNDGKVSGPYRFSGKAWVRKYLGTTTQTVDYILNQADSSPFNSSFRGRGITYLAIRLRHGDKAYPSGVPVVTCKIKGKKILDTRTSTTAWSDNPALVVRDYLVNEIGFDASSIDDSTVNAAANICDQLVNVPDSGTQKRYTCNILLLATEQWEDNLRLLIDTMSGHLTYRDGKWRIYAGAWDPGSITISQKDWVGPIQVQTSAAREERWNAVRTFYVDKDRDWMRVEAYPRTEASYETMDGNERIWQELEVPGCNSDYQAQRHGEFMLRQSRNQVKIMGRLRPEFIKISTWDTVLVTDDQFGWSLKTFRVISMEMTPDGNVDVAMVEEGAATWADLDPTEYNQPGTGVFIDPSGGLQGPLVVDPFFDLGYDHWASATSGSAEVSSQGYITWVETGGSQQDGAMKFIAGGTPNYFYDRYIWTVRTPAYSYVTGQKFTVNIRWRRTSSFAVVNSYGGDIATLPALRPWLYAYNENSLSAVGGNGYLASWQGYVTAAQVAAAPINEWQTFETIIDPQSYYYPLPNLRAALESQIQYCNSGATIEVDAFDAYLGGGGVTFAGTQAVYDGTEGAEAIAPDVAAVTLDRLFRSSQHRAGKATAQCDLGNVSGTIVIDCSSSNVFRVRLTGNAYLTTSNMLEGQFVTVRVKQNGAGGKVMSYAPYVSIASGHAIATGPDKKSLIGMQWDEVDSEWNGTIGKGW